MKNNVCLGLRGVGIYVGRKIKYILKKKKIMRFKKKKRKWELKNGVH